MKRYWCATALRLTPSINANQSRIEMGIAESEGANERRPIFGSRVLENRGQFLGED